MTVAFANQPVPLSTGDDGVIRLAGSRVTLDTVISAYQRGATPEQIAQSYSSLQIADIYAVLAYYLRHRQEVEGYLERRREQSRRVRREFEERFPPNGLRERLLSRLS